MRIKEEMQSTYLTFYMNKIVSLSANKLILNIYKCKKLPFTAYQFLQMDITQIKETLIAVVKTDQSTLCSIQKHILIKRIFRIMSLLLIKLLVNLKISLNCCNYLIRNLQKGMRCLWKEVLFKILIGYFRLEAARKLTLWLLSNQQNPKICDYTSRTCYYTSIHISTLTLVSDVCSKESTS